MNKPISNLLAVILLSLVAACGWQLRGTPDLPPSMDVIHIQTGDPYSRLARELKRLLGSGDSRITDNPDEATAILRLLSSGSRRQVLSVNLEGRPQEIRVLYELSFDMRTPEGEVLIEQQRLEINRDISTDPTDPLGASQEAQRVAEALEGSIAQSVLLRIEALANRPSFGEGIGDRQDVRSYTKGIRIDAEDADTPIARELHRRIDSGKVELPWDDEATQVTVRISSAGSSQEILSVDEEGQPEEIRLNQVVEYDFQDEEGNALGESQRIEVDRTVTIDSGDPLGADQEVRRITRSLENEIVETIVQQLKDLQL